ncbi:MAG: Succinate dehydrogenase cytochrome b-556 subunit, partial [uncultured Quadrisphaera sp.]
GADHQGGEGAVRPRADPAPAAQHPGRLGPGGHPLPRPRGHVVVGGPPDHRRAHLRLPAGPRARHLAGAGLPRGLRRRHRDLQEPRGRPRRGRAGRRGALPRLQRRADHARRLLAPGRPLPAPDVLGRRRPLGPALRALPGAPPRRRLREPL